MTLPGTRKYNYMSHNSNIARDEYLAETYNLDTAPQYRQDIFGEVWPTTALERKKQAIKKFNDTWGINELNHQKERFDEAVVKAQKTSEEMNESLERLFNSLSRV
jgi:hypothetical protein